MDERLWKLFEAGLAAFEDSERAVVNHGDEGWWVPEEEGDRVCKLLAEIELATLEAKEEEIVD